MDRFERDSLGSSLLPLLAASAMKLVNAESRATGSGIFVAGLFHPGNSALFCQEGPPAIQHPDGFFASES